MKLLVKAGEMLRLKSARVFHTELGTRMTTELNAPKGRELVVLVLGVSDPAAPFDLDAMLGAMGYQKVPNG